MNERFVFVLPGWEGAAGDSRVLDSAFHGDFSVPNGKYYLADAGTSVRTPEILMIGYGLSTEVLTPYRGVRYHLKEWSQIANARPTDYKELFNLRHASLRNVIERRFGTRKRQFRILLGGSEYPCDVQVKIITALAIVSNYILDDGEIPYGDGPSGDEDEESDLDNPLEASYRDNDRVHGQANSFRNRLATQMWRDYRAHLDRLGRN